MALGIWGVCSAGWVGHPPMPPYSHSHKRECARKITTMRVQTAQSMLILNTKYKSHFGWLVVVHRMQIIEFLWITWPFQTKPVRSIVWMDLRNLFNGVIDLRDIFDGNKIKIPHHASADRLEVGWNAHRNILKIEQSNHQYRNKT